MNSHLVPQAFFGAKQKQSPPRGGLSSAGDDCFHPLPREESIALLRECTTRLRKSQAASLNRLAECMGDLPLGLQLAGRYINAGLFLSIDSYLAEIQKTAASLPESVLEWSKGSAIPQAQNLAAAFLCSYRLLVRPGGGRKLAQPLLWAAGFCAPGVGIPEGILWKAVDAANQQKDFEAALERLYDLAFLAWTENGPALPAPACALSRCLAPAETPALAKLTDALIAFVEEASGGETSPLPHQVLDHLKVAAEFCEQKGEAAAGRVWNTLGHCCWKEKNANGALKAFQKGLAQDEQRYGKEHQEIAAGCSNLGQVLYELEDYEGARVYLERALELEDKLFSSKSLVVAADLMNLGRVLYRQGNLARAKTCFEHAVGIYGQAYQFGPRHAETANGIYHLGLVLADLGSWPSAKTCFEKSLAIHEWVYGKNHPSVATDLNQIGRALRMMGELVKAKECFERLMEHKKKLSGKDICSDSFTLNQLGLVLQDLGDLKGARSCFEQALAVDEQLYGEEHLLIARDANNLGCVLRDIGDLPAARVCFRRALAINERISQPENRDIAINANNLGRVLYSLEDLSGARECFEKVLRIDEAFYGIEHTEVAKAAVNLGTVLHELEELDSARKNFERALSIFEKNLPNDHPKLVDARKNLERVKKHPRQAK